MTWKLYEGDCLEIMRQLPSESVDLIFTDPPYPRQYQYCYDYLANEAPRLMKDGASLLTIVGHYAVEDVMERFKSKLKYRWMLCMNQFDGKHARMAMGIEVTWKPILWYVKRAYPQGRGFLRDGVKIDGKDGQEKTRHKWEQDISYALYYIEKLTKPGDTVLDPFAGSGTTLEAAVRLRRKAIGIEIDPKHCQTIRQRMSALDGALFD